MSDQRSTSETRVRGPQVVRLHEDGTEETIPVEGELVIGRTEGDVRIPSDPYVSGRHAGIRLEHGRHVLHDMDSTNGTFIRIRGELELRPGDVVLIGDQVFLFLD